MDTPYVFTVFCTVYRLREYGELITRDSAFYMLGVDDMLLFERSRHETMCASGGAGRCVGRFAPLRMSCFALPQFQSRRRWQTFRASIPLAGRRQAAGWPGIDSKATEREKPN